MAMPAASRTLVIATIIAVSALVSSIVGIRVLRAGGQRICVLARRSRAGRANDGGLLDGDPALRRVQDSRVDPLARTVADDGRGRGDGSARRMGCCCTSMPRCTASDSGVFLCAYGVLRVFRRDDLVVRGSAWRDAAAGALSGLAGGLAGLSGSFVTIWCSMRGWDKLRQRAVYQPFILVDAGRDDRLPALGGIRQSPCRR